MSSFHEGFPHQLAPAFDLGIFHDVRHLNLQTNYGWNFFYIQNAGAIHGFLPIHISEAKGVSPYKSPFGSFLFSDSMSDDNKREFIAFCEDRLKQKGVNAIHLKNQPEAYGEKPLALNQILTSSGYRIETEETSAIISVTENSFESALHKSEKKRLRKCQNAGFRVERLDLTHISKVYDFLEFCRGEKGYSLSMDFEGVQKLVQNFPDHIVLTAVLDQGKLAAANISIRVYDHVLYNFYHDHAQAYDQFSPVVTLNEGLYKLCQESNIQLLDLGTSNTGNEINESLLQFKLHLGAKPSRKLTFVKML